MSDKAGGTDGSRILFFLPWQFDMVGGVDVVVDRVWREIERTMPRRSLIGVQDWIFDGQKNDPEGRSFLHLNFPAPLAGRPLSLRYLVTAMRRLPMMLARLRRYDIQVVNFHFPRLNVYPLALLKRLGLWRGRIVLSFHGSDVQEIDPHNPAWRLIASQTDALTACSAALADRVKAIGLFGQMPISVIHNGIDRAHFQAESEDGGIPAGTSFILNIGNYVPHKAQDVLIKAFAQVADSVPGLKLVLAGGTAENDAWLNGLRQLAAELNIIERVFFLGSISQRQVAELMRRAVCLAHASLSEAFGLVLIEAAACKLPVIATRVGGVPEIIPSPEYGLLVEPGDVAGMSAALSALLCAPQEAQCRADRLLERVETIFSVGAMARAYFDVCMES